MLTTAALAPCSGPTGACRVVPRSLPRAPVGPGAARWQALNGTPAWKRRRRAHSVAPQPYIVLTSRPDSSTALWVGIVDFLAHR